MDQNWKVGKLEEGMDQNLEVGKHEEPEGIHREDYCRGMKMKYCCNCPFDVYVCCSTGFFCTCVKM